MQKTLLIIQREYLTRVKKKTFIISTVLFPLLYLGLIFGSGYLAAKGGRNLNIAVVDSSGYFDRGLIARENQKDSSAQLSLVNTSADSLKNNFTKMGYDGYIVIPADLNWETGNNDITVHTSRTLTGESISPVQQKFNSIWNSVKNEKLGLDEGKISILAKSTLRLNPQNVNNQKSDARFSSIFGYVAGFLIYFILMIYGSQVMMGVMEEKTNRIAEVLVSSVKPFQLMLGKIIGIGLVALTQFLLWIIFIYLIYNLSGVSSGGNMGAVLGSIQDAFTSVNIPLIVSCFIFYLLGGFFFYASLYAAIGSAVNEDMREAQSLSFPITMLVIISIVMLTSAMRDPTGPIAVWGSIIPFSSPIIMIARIPFGVPETVPYWQLGLSMLLLVVGFFLTTWFAGKIYRTGILMYGKKPTWGEMLKWVFRKQ